jgi:hypothetical protein
MYIIQINRNKMKKLLGSCLYMVAMALLFSSCKKDLPLVILDTSNPKSAKLSATESKIVLMEARESNTAIIFNWTRPAYNFEGSFKHTLQFAKAGTNFASPLNESAGTDLTKAYTEKAFNALMLSLGIPALTQGNVEVRVKSVLSDSVAPLYSNTQNIAVTPYNIEQFLYVPGDYQGWDPASAGIIRSPAKNKQYEGYIYIAGGSGEFKFTDAPNWNNGIFGDATTGTSGNVASPGNNFKVGPPGFFKINANLNNNTWTQTKTSWGLIGDAIPTTGWNSDVDMSYDAATKTYKITIDLNAGAIKFRANDDWPINFGDDGANGTLEYNGSNIAIGSTGNYTITLDLRGGNGKYTYVVKKN